MTVGLAVLPILFVLVSGFVVFALVATVIGLIIPAIPFVLLGLLIWALVKKTPVPAI
jgi:tetrahydromethanopterin S-methyltransferase subunit C